MGTRSCPEISHRLAEGRRHLTSPIGGIMPPPPPTQRLADRIKQHVPTSIRKKSNTVREQSPRLCKNNNSKINCESAIGQHLLANQECAKTYTDDNFRIIGQARSSFHLSVLESVYIKTQNPVLCKQKDFIFSLGIFK